MNNLYPCLKEVAGVHSTWGAGEARGSRQCARALCWQQGEMMGLLKTPSPSHGAASLFALKLSAFSSVINYTFSMGECTVNLYGLSLKNIHSDRISDLLLCASASRLRRARGDAWRIALVLTFTELPSLSALARGLSSRHSCVLKDHQPPERTEYG